MGFQDQTGREIDWDKVKAAIFDVDGTLYCQRPVRIRMALKMGRFFLLHPRRWREAAGIYYFRKLREQEEYRTQSPEAQAAAAAEESTAVADSAPHERASRAICPEPEKKSSTRRPSIEN